MYLLPLCLDAKRVETVKHSVQNFLRPQVTYGVFKRSSKRPANFSKCIQNTRVNAGRLLDRVNTLLNTNEDVAQMFQFKRVMPWLHAPISSSEMLSDVAGPSEVYKPCPRKSSRV